MPLVPASQIESRPIAWLWPWYLARGYLTMLDGDPGLGKSWLTLDLCARLSKGRPFPNGAASLGPANSILLTSEDGTADIIKARLAGLGADMSRIFLWQREAGEALPRFPSQTPWLEDMVERTGAVFVVIDPIVAFLDASVLVGSESQVRNALDPLAAMAQRRQCTGLMQRHLNKQTSLRALYRGSHSIAFNAVCRTCWLVGPDPDAAGRVVLAQHKNNFAPLQPSLCFSMPQTEMETTLTWHGESRRSADELVAQAPLRSLQLARACAFLADFLKPGPRLGRDVKAAARQHGVSKRTLDRARANLLIKIHYVRSCTPNQQTYWLLPGQEMRADLQDPIDAELEPVWRKLRADAAELSKT